MPSWIAARIRSRSDLIVRESLTNAGMRLRQAQASQWSGDEWQLGSRLSGRRCRFPPKATPTSACEKRACCPDGMPLVVHLGGHGLRRMIQDLLTRSEVRLD
jgi:hypothetical protein